MSAGVVSGVADRACAFVLAGYCALTALLWKQFWRPGDFWISSTGKARALFWDFWKNLALAAGFFSSSWDRCVLGRTVLRPSDDLIPSL